MTNREYVEQAWENARFESVFDNSRAWLHDPRVPLPRDRGRVLADRPGGGVWILSGNANTPFEISKALTEAAAWAAARAYTEDLKEQIRQAQEDIENLRDWGEDLPVECPAFASYQRILGLAQARLQDLKRGLKENL